MAAVAVAVVTSPRGVLAVRRADSEPSWAFPGGQIEPGETPAAAGEAREETGCTVRVTGILGRRLHPVTGADITYLAAEPLGPTNLAAGPEDEIAEVRWLSLAEATDLMENMYAPVAAHLARAMAGRLP
ncbi:MAG: NUDIX hydrolase [Streptosporangiaceae bacterium]